MSFPQQYRFIKPKEITPRSYVDSILSLISFLDDTIDSKMKKGEGGVRLVQKIRRQVIDIKKSYPKIVHQRKSVARKAPTGLTEKRIPSPKLAAFLKSTAPISQSEVMTAIRAYVHIDPEETRPSVLKWKALNPKTKKFPNGRDLRNPARKNIIFPDEVLSTLLNYDSYVEKVNEGGVFIKKRNQETGVRELVVWEDTRLYGWTIAKLISFELRKA